MQRQKGGYYTSARTSRVHPLTPRRTNSRILLGTREKLYGKLGHLRQSHPHDRSLGVTPQLQPIHKPSSESDDILQRSSEGDTSDVLYGGHLESVGIEDGGPEVTFILSLGTHCGFTELLSNGGER